MIDISCSRCGEPWDLYGLVHDERIFDEEVELEGLSVGELSPGFTETIGAHRSNGFRYVAPDGFEEAKEGCVLILSCPCCPKEGAGC